MKQRYYWGVLLAFWYHVQSLDALYHITAERPVSLLMETCSHERKPITDNTMLFFPEKVKLCTTFFTSKRKGHYEKDVKRTANLHSVVKISWNDVDSIETCTIHYKLC
uniref:Secreted protein n=1 Tax=Parascaris univalens TaxID=6257 RepID=A0A915AGB6_PARUN